MVFLLGCCALLGACASRGSIAPGYALQDSGSLPAANPRLEHVVAWIPMERAQTATVAEAMTHIALRDARDNTSRDLCSRRVADSAQVLERHGPVAAVQPDSLGGGPAWYYRISLAPGASGCRTVQPSIFMRALQAHLPGWLRLEPAAAHHADSTRAASANRG